MGQQTPLHIGGLSIISPKCCFSKETVRVPAISVPSEAAPSVMQQKNETDRTASTAPGAATADAVANPLPMHAASNRFLQQHQQQLQDQRYVQHSTIHRKSSSNVNVNLSVNQSSSGSSSPMNSSFHSVFQPQQANQSSSNAEKHACASPMSSPSQSHPHYHFHLQSPPLVQMAPIAASASPATSPLALSRPGRPFASPAASPDSYLPLSLPCHSTAPSAASRSRSIYSALAVISCSMLTNSNSLGDQSPSVSKSTASYDEMHGPHRLSVQAPPAFPGSSPLASPMYSQDFGLPVFSSLFQPLMRESSITIDPNLQTMPTLAMSPISNESISAVSSNSSAFSQSSPAASPALPSLWQRISSPAPDLLEANQRSNEDMDIPCEPPDLQAHSSSDSSNSSPSFTHSDLSPLALSPPSPLAGDLVLSPEVLLALEPEAVYAISDELEHQTLSQPTWQQKRGRKRRASSATVSIDSSEEAEQDELSAISALSSPVQWRVASPSSVMVEDLDEKQFPPSLSSSSSSTHLTSRTPASAPSSSSSSSSATSRRHVPRSEKERKNLKRSKKRRTTKKEKGLSAIFTHYPSYSTESACLLYPAKEVYFHPPHSLPSTVPSDFASSQWVRVPDVQPGFPLAPLQEVLLSVKEVSGFTQSALIVAVDLGAEAGPQRHFLLFSSVSLFHDAKSLATTSSAMRNRAQKKDDAAFIDLSNQSLYLRALPSELALETSPMVHAFAPAASAREFVLRISTDGYALRYRDRVNAKKAESYASLLVLGGAELKLAIMPSKRFPKAAIQYVALHDKIDDGLSAAERVYPRRNGVCWSDSPVVL